MKRSAKRRYRRRKSKIASILSIILIVLAVCVLALAGYKLYTIYHGYKEADDIYAGIEKSVFTGDADFEDSGIQWNFDALLALCPDAVGYIYQKDVMSYPIVQAEDNDKYLRTLITGEYNVAGSIFVDARFPEGMEGQYSIVYGHNMYNTTAMFATLPEYESEEYYQEHPYFDIYIGYKHYRYYVFSAFVADVDGFVYTFDLEPGDYKQQFDRLRAECAYETDVRELEEYDHVIVLSTCVNSRDYNYRNVVCLVRGEEVP